VLVVLFCIYVALLLLVMGQILMVRHAQLGGREQDAASLFLEMLKVLVGATSAIGSLLAMAAGAYAVSGEIQTGTILTVLARPVARWEFLSGSFLGVQALLWVYVAFMLVFELVISRIAHQHIATSWWLLIAYPAARFLLYSAVACFFSTMLRPLPALGVTFLFSALAISVEGPVTIFARLPHWVLSPFQYLLPSVGQLAEARFIVLTSTPLRYTPLSDQLIPLAHGLDYALVMLLFAALIFRHRALVRA
jgi:ABC-type transport system involved in multi-copper enzyme maturation permease subunit